MSWDAALYARFAQARLRPAADLIARIKLEAPARIVDLGCGTGAATALLARRWPEARITGVDASAAMLREARQRDLEVDWREIDIAAWKPDARFDLVFSNAALHWLGDHAALLPALFERVAPRGVLAVQMPLNHDAPSHRSVEETIEAGPWREQLAPLWRAHPVAPPGVYADLLAGPAAALDVWETTYHHRLVGTDPVAEWMRGTTLTPLLAALERDPADAFFEDYARRVRRAYPPDPDGVTAFPFRRLFLIATRPSRA